MNGRGYKSKFGWAPQDDFGTGVVPTEFAKTAVGGLKVAFGVKPIDVPLAEGVDIADFVESKRDPKVTVNTPMLFQGLETLLKHACGGAVVSTQIGSTGVYTHRFALADELPAAGLSLHCENDAEVMGTAYRIDSAKINKMTLTQEQEKPLMLALDFVGRALTPVDTEDASYPAMNMVKWTQMSTMKANNATFKGQTSEWSLENSLADDIYLLGSQDRDAIDRKDQRKISGKFKALMTGADLYNLYLAQTPIVLATEWTGPVAAGSTHYKTRINVAKAILTGTSPENTDHGPIWVEIPWVAFFNLTDDIIGIEIDNLLTSIP